MTGGDLLQKVDGPGRIDAEQRALLIDAFTRVAAERGYAHTTAEEVSRRAGLSNDVFEANFPIMRHCLTAAYDAFLARLAAQMGEAVDDEAEWPAQVQAAVAAGIEFLLETASRARVFAVEAVVVGPPLLERYVASVEAAAGLLRRGRERYPRAASLPAGAESVLVGGICFRIRALLLAEEGSRLPELEKEFLELLLRPYLGEHEARRLAAAA